MKGLTTAIFLYTGLLHFTSCSKQSAEPVVGDMVVSSDKTITADMTVGNLTIEGKALMTIDYSDVPAHTFVVKGNILVKDEAQLIVRGSKGLMNDGFIIANDFSSQYTFTSTDDSRVTFENIGIRTQAGSVLEKGNVYMSFNVSKNSAMVVDGAKLDNESSWILGTFKGKSTLEIINSVNVPTETYLGDSCTVFVSGAQTRTGLWLPLTSGDHTVPLPDVSTGSWSWNAGNSLGAGVHWSLSVSNSNPGLGIQLFPNASATIHGHGGQTKELTMGYFASPGNETIDNLHVGLQNGVIVPGRLTLNNVQLGPIAWQIYSVTPTSLTINNSTINEIGIIGSGTVNINNSVIQLAVLACYGSNSSLNVNTCDVWSQSIETNSNGKISMTNCKVFGSQFIARPVESKISLTGGSFQNNPTTDPAKTPIDLVTGYPNYNPFCAPGPPKKAGAGIITCSNVANCTW